MAATQTALMAQQPGSSVATAYPQVAPNGIAAQNLDLLQIINSSGLILLNVSSDGLVHNPAVSATNGTRTGQFLTRLTSAATTAQLFADTFSNPSLLDILQVIAEYPPVKQGGSVVYYLDYLGVAH